MFRIRRACPPRVLRDKEVHSVLLDSVLEKISRCVSVTPHTTHVPSLFASPQPLNTRHHTTLDTAFPSPLLRRALRWRGVAQVAARRSGRREG